MDTANLNTNDINIPQPVGEVPIARPTEETADGTHPSSVKLANLSFEEFSKLDIFEILGMQNATQEQKNEVEAKMLDAVRAKALDRVDQTLAPEAQAEWKNIVDGDNEDELEPFFQRNNISLSDIMIEEAVKYKMELLQLNEDQGN